MSNRIWTDEELEAAVKVSYSYANVIRTLSLVPSGGNYVQVQYAIKRLGLNVDHFKGMGWSKGSHVVLNPARPLNELLVLGSRPQSYGLKLRLYNAGLKSPKCELCGWRKKSEDGRIPVELDHINGNHWDNRLVNLRILCPNCHSLQKTHRGKNKGSY